MFQGWRTGLQNLLAEFDSQAVCYFMLLDLKHLLSVHQININGVIQPGAHYGQEQSIYDQLGIPDDNRFYFEPQKDVFEILSRNVGKRGYLFNCALGNDNKKVVMNIERDNQSQSSSILEPSLHLQQYPHIRFTGREEVNMFRLDDIFPANKLNNNWLMNIDCQGYELEVLKGSQKILPYVQALVCEVNRADVYKGCPMVGDIDQFLSRFQFTRLEVDWSQGITWSDAFYFKVIT